MKEQLVKSTDKIYDGISKCTSITVHETANEKIRANAQAHANLQSDGGARQASWHIQVDDVQAIRSYPDTAKCWHAGPAAADSIAVEICVNADGDYNAAFKRAAEVVAELRAEHGLTRTEVKQHFDWSGKDCPAGMRLADRWQEFLSLTDGEANMSTMVSPFDGRLTQNHGDSGGYRGHKGMDIAPPKPGQTGMPVYAAFAGTWKKISRNVKPGNKRSTWATGRTGGGGLIANPDGEGNGYNHIDVLDHWKVGDKVQAGDLLGYNDRSGNQTAPHLHFELWSDWRNHNSDYDPQLAFRKFSVKPGSAPSKTSVVKPQASKPKPKPSGPKPSTGGNDKGDYIAIAKALNKMGLKAGYPDGVNGPMLKNATKAFQKQHGLVQDGNWGAVTQTKFEEVKAIQRALQKQGYTKQGVDGYYGAQTTANIKDFQRRTGLVQDGKAGSITQKKLGL